MKPPIWRRPALLEHLGLILLLVAIALLAARMDWLWRWDNLVYDAQLRYWSAPAPDDVVIVAVDETSLASLGRWPWSRHLHAQLIDRLSAEDARAIGIDMIFAEADTEDLSADADLARAIAASGRVVLPVVVEQTRLGGQLLETLPIPALAGVAAGLGHAHFELDPDSIARRTYLYEGLGQAHWPALALALLQVAGSGAVADLAPPGPDMETTPGVWRRSSEVLLPFIGAPGHFQQISYLQVLNGDYPSDAFRDRLVLVGTTATGLGDILPTPVSGHERPMAGVELNANLLQALRNQTLLRPAPQAWRLTVLALIAALPLLLFPRLTPRMALLLVAALLAGSLAGSAALLYLARVWLAPAPAMLALLLSYPLWSWRRLERALRFLRQELDRLGDEQARLPSNVPPRLSSALQFLDRLLPLAGWHARDARGRTLLQRGRTPPAPGGRVPGNRWQHHGNYWWTHIGDASGIELCLEWAGTEPPNAGQRRSLELLRELLSRPAEAPAYGAVASVEAHIRKVQSATRQLQDTRRILDQGLARMADGAMVISPFGQVSFANPQASLLMQGEARHSLVSDSFPAWLARSGIQDTQPWYEAIGRALVDGQPGQIALRSPQQRDLLVQFTPLGDGREAPAGVVINLADVTRLKDSERRRAEALSFLSHDLRTPLVSLLALLEVAGESADRDPDLMRRARAHAGKTLALAEQFLELARVESSADVVFDGIDLVNVAANACDEVWSHARQRNISIDRDLQLEEAWIRGDGPLLERAIGNLLSNAVKYSPAGTRVALSLALQGTELHCTVVDQGRGIAAEEIPHLFDRFTRGREGHASGQTGSGLGLAFVKAVAERHGGRVEVHSAPGHGSRFDLVLPLDSPPAPP